MNDHETPGYEIYRAVLALFVIISVGLGVVSSGPLVSLLSDLVRTVAL